MIDNLDFGKLNSDEIFSFLNLLAAQIEAGNPEALKIKDEFDALVALIPKLLLSLNKEKASKETKELLDLDKERDNAITGLAKYVDGLTFRKDTQIKAAAELVDELIKSYGPQISRQSYPIETSTLTKLYKKLTTEENYVAAVATLQLQPWLEEINTPNQLFEKKFNERTTSVTKVEKIPSFTNMRKEATATYQALVDLLLSRYKIALADKQPTEAYKKAIDELQTLVNSYQIYTKSPASRKKDKEDEKP